MSVLVAFGGKCRPFRGKQMFQLHSSILSGIFVSWFSNPFNWNLRKRQCISAVLLSGKKNFFNFFNWKRWAPFTFECYQTFRKFRNASKRFKNFIGNLQKTLAKLLNSTELKNAVYLQKNQEILWEKSNGTEGPSETFSETLLSGFKRELTPFATFESWRPN